MSNETNTDEIISKFVFTNPIQEDRAKFLRENPSFMALDPIKRHLYLIGKYDIPNGEPQKLNERI